MPNYPVGQTTGIVSLYETAKSVYNWTNTTFNAPPQEELLIYELLIRDFVTTRNYQTLIDTLDYIERLGVNAIELMPNSEFEGNLSWGYNPSFHMALDKYYGTPDKFREFVDSCHSRGIAVIMDQVFNHAFGQNPIAQMWWDSNNNRPAANNPYMNQNCPTRQTVGGTTSTISCSLRVITWTALIPIGLRSSRLTGSDSTLPRGSPTAPMQITTKRRESLL